MPALAGPARRFFIIMVFLISALGLYPAVAGAHIFKLYSGTSEELKERIVLHYSPEQVAIDYTGEYHGQLAPHIRFMMDADQNQRISPQEMRQFIDDYRQAWDEAAQQRLFNLDNLGFRIALEDCAFEDLRGVKLVAPLTVTMRFVSQSLRANPSHQTNLHLLEIDQAVWLAFGRQFMRMAQRRAAFTDEQAGEIVQYCQITIQAPEQVEFTRCYPGYIRRKKNVITGIFYENSLSRTQFAPVAKFSTTFLIHDRDEK